MSESEDDEDDWFGSPGKVTNTCNKTYFKLLSNCSTRSLPSLLIFTENSHGDPSVQFVDDDNSLNNAATPTGSHRIITLYIQMEYCTKRTLRQVGT